MSLKAPIGFEAWRYPDRRLTRAPVLKRICWSGADGDASFTPTTATTYSFPRLVMYYRNLVIGSLATLTPPTDARVQILCVSETLQLAGVINASGRGGPGGAGGVNAGGPGGAGGGGIVVIARKITGTGIIRANGANGGNGGAGTATNDGGDGGAGALKTISIPGGVRGVAVGGGGGGAGIWGNGGASGGDIRSSGGTSPKAPQFLFVDTDLYADGYGGGGGGGSSSAGGHGGGGGGGGGGLIVIISDDPIPGLTLQAIGGGGGAGYNYGGGGGGGGGGLIIVVAPGDSSTKSVSGGAGGTGRSAGLAGGAGLALFIQAYPHEVI